MILIIEDDLQIVRLVERLVRKMYGATQDINTAASAAEAIALLQTHTYDLIISDFMLLRGTGGEVLQWLRSMTGSFATSARRAMVDRFVFFSGSIFECQTAWGPDYQPCKLIEKGITPKDFVAKLAALAPHMQLQMTATALRASGLIAIDVDPRNGGTATRETLETDYGLLPRDMHQSTPSGGEHFIMRDPSPGDDAAKEVVANVNTKISDIIYEFDRWLAIQVLNRSLAHEDLPKLNDAFREYFASTRTAKSEG